MKEIIKDEKWHILCHFSSLSVKNELYFIILVLYSDSQKEGNTMDKLSELLQEAKPLYIQRKKRSQFVKCLLCIISLVIFCTFAILPFTINNNSDNGYSTTSTSIVEDMGLPTDDYGLLKVD